MDFRDGHYQGYDPAIELERERRANDNKLKTTFERIFEKYGKDFSNVGDEIDMETGEIVVDHGHIAYMRHERDVGGTSASSQFVRAFAEEMEEEDSGSVESEDDQEEDNEADELSSEFGKHGAPSRMEDTPGSEGDVEDSEGSAVRSTSHATGGSSLRKVQSDSEDSLLRSQEEDSPEQRQQPQPTIEQTTAAQIAAGGIMNIVPAISNSLATIVPQTSGQPLQIDPVAIQQLGQNIANEIVKFLMNLNNPVAQHNPSNPWSVPELPVDAFAPPRYLEARSRHGLTPRPRRLSPSPAMTPNPGQSLWEPERVPKRRRGMIRETASRPSNLPSVGHLLRSRTDGQHQRSIENRPQQLLLDEGFNHRYTSNNHQPTAYDIPVSENEDPAMAVNRSDGYSANTKRRVHSLRVKFTPKEDEMIKRLKEIDRLPWQEIGDLFPGRSVSSIQGRYSRVLKDLSLPLLQKASSSPFRREIVEILDDETEDDATVYTIEDYPRIKYEDEHEELRTPYAAPSARRLEQTPLLRRALGKRIVEHATPQRHDRSYHEIRSDLPQGSIKMESDPPMPPQLVENPWVDEQTLGQPPYAPVVPSMLSKAVPGYTQQEEEAEREDDEGEWHGDHLLPIPVPDEDTEDEWLPYRADDRYSDEEASFLPSKSVYKTPKSTRKQPYYIEDSENYLMDGMDVDTGAESDDDTEAEVDALGADSATPPARDVTLTGSGRPGKRKRTIDPNENEFDASRPELSIEPARTQEMMPGPSTSTNGAFDTLEFTATKMRKKAIEILRLKIQQATLDGNPYTREEITQMYEEIQERYPIKVSFPELRLEPRKPLSSTKRIARRQRDPGEPRAKRQRKKKKRKTTDEVQAEIAAAIAEERAAVEKAALEKAQQTAREQAAQAAEKAAHGPPPIPTPPSSGHARKLIAQNALATYNSPAALILQRVRAEATTIPNTESPSLSRIADSSSKRQEDKARIDSEPPARHMFNDRHDVDEDNNEDNTSIFLSRSGATIESTFDQMTRKLPRTARDHFHHKVQRIADANRVGTPDDTDSQAEKPAPPSMADARAKIAAAMAEISQYTKPATPRPVPARPGATPAVQTPKLFTNPERAQPESAPLPRPDPPESFLAQRSASSIPAQKPHLDSQPLRPSATKLASQDSATATATADVTIIATRENVTNSVPPSQPPTRTILPQIHRTRSQSKALRSSSPVPWISQPSSRSSSSARKRYHPTNQAVGIPLGEHPELAAHYVRKEPPPQQRRIVEVGDEEDELA